MCLPRFFGFFLITLLLFLTVEILTASTSTSRQLVADINPRCFINETNCTSWTNISLIHIRADGSNDSIHFIYSFHGAPSFLLIRSALDTTLNVNWTAYSRQELNSISFNGTQPFYSFGYILNKVWIYNDTNDDVRIDLVNQTDVTGYDAKYFSWERKTFGSILSASDVELTFISKRYQNRNFGTNGFFRINIRAKEIDGYSEILPYMLHNTNMTQIDYDFSHVQMSPEENPTHARIAFEFVMVQGDEQGRSKDAKIRVERVETLDDEHTPGVFSTINVRTPVVGEYDQSFLQWKPICYTQLVRDITNSIDVTSYDLQDYTVTFQNSTLEGSLLWGYYGAQLDAVMSQAMNISFGTKKDGFYNATPHLSWTHMSGFGVPPEDYVSLLVILIVSIGFGIPALIITVASIVIVCKRMRRPRDEVLLRH